MDVDTRKQICKGRVCEALLGVDASLRGVNRTLLAREFKHNWKTGRMKTLIRGMLATIMMMREDMWEDGE